jgi:DNA-binding CsgD family transcriptional regulator
LIDTRGRTWKRAQDELAEWEQFVFGSKPAVREKKVAILQDVADGLRLQEIAVRLGMTEQYVKNLLRDIRDRLECATTAQAVATAIRRGLID